MANGVMAMLALVPVVFALMASMAGMAHAQNATTGAPPTECTDIDEAFCASYLQLCSTPLYQEKCCASCATQAQREPIYICTSAMSPEPELCTDLASQHCAKVQTGFSSCYKIPDEVFPDLYVRVPVVNEREALYTLHRDPFCETHFAQDEVVAEFVSLGECHQVEGDLGKPLFTMTLFVECSNSTAGWDCFGDRLHCEHWTRQSFERCTLPSDGLTRGAENACIWDFYAGECKSKAFDHCSSDNPPSCTLPHCEFDATLSRCVPIRSCKCSKSGLSGAAPVFQQGCTDVHAETGVTGAICYINGGADAIDACPCSIPSTVYPGAAYKACVPSNGCTTITLSSNVPMVQGQFVYSDDSHSPLGCVPLLTYHPVQFGLVSTYSLVRPDTEGGLQPDNYLLRRLDPSWVIITDAALSFPTESLRTTPTYVFDDTLAVSRILYSYADGMTTTNADDISGTWYQSIHARVPAFDVSASCDARYPCPIPILSVSSDNLDLTLTLSERIELLASYPDLHTHLTRVLSSNAYQTLTNYIIVSTTDSISGFVSPGRAEDAFGADVATAETPDITLECKGFSRVDPALTLTPIVSVFPAEDLSPFATFTLVLEPFSVYSCEVMAESSDCAGLPTASRVIITPQATPTIRPTISVLFQNETCIVVEASPPGQRIGLYGTLKEYEFQLILGATIIAQVHQLEPVISFGNLKPGTVYALYAGYENEVGEGPFAEFEVATRDGVPLAAPTLRATRTSDETIQLGWEPLSQNLLQGTIVRYFLIVISTTRSLDYLESIIETVVVVGQRRVELPDGLIFEAVHASEGRATSFVLSDLSANAHYAIAIAAENNEHLGSYGLFRIVPVYSSTTPTSSGSGSSSTISIIAFILIPIVLSILVFIIYRQVPRAPTIPLTDEELLFELSSASDVVVDEVMHQDEECDLFSGTMIPPNYFAIRGQFGGSRPSNEGLPTKLEHSANLEMADDLQHILDMSAKGVPNVPALVRRLHDPKNHYLVLLYCNEVSALVQLKSMETPPVLGLLGFYFRPDAALLCYTPVQSTLRDSLRRNRPNMDNFTPMTEEHLFDIALKVAQALVFLREKEVTHRNLSTRGFFVTDSSQVQLGDFYLAKLGDDDHVPPTLLSEYVNVRWQAPESISDSQYTFASDMFVAGVVLWEIFSYGKRPWAGYNNAEVAQTVAQRGTHLDKPVACSHKAYKIMLQCWKMTPAQRITPKTLEAMITDCLLEAREETDSFEGAQFRRESTTNLTHYLNHDLGQLESQI